MSQVVKYTTGDDDGLEVFFEIEPQDGYHDVVFGKTVGAVRDAVHPAVAAAADVLDRFKALSPDEVEITFGVKVSGTMNWLVAKAASEGSFEVKLRWRSGEDGSEA
ncbi:hypothetical protein KDK95_08785 [Actinospica sp. MGRD01-02]|uniref:Trypsin-co-occurring domain-containing protein n=1 Tax=Actinospica acidithermotolerans TaxID=2828514 RepID=A0A941IFJ3_9ACTN|nr:CU044_2847 family protein [Actinospica acidithermotolerans]MBR7826395.1 hypothetical protein [Actinospica acidithermotolerans]